MDVIKIVLDQLKHEGISATYEEGRIVWHSDSNEEHYIYETDISYLAGKLAWFQSSCCNNHLLCIFYDNGECFSWQPITYNDAFGCDCYLIEWYDDYLTFVYQEKHDVYICVIRNKEVAHFNFHGEEITRKNDIFYFREYHSQNSNTLKRLKLPELLHLEPLTQEEASKHGVVIASIDYLNDLRRLK